MFKRVKPQKNVPNIKWKFNLICSITIITIFLIYTFISLFFISHFQFNTYINGKDFSLKRHDEINTYLANQVHNYKLTLHAKNGMTDIITGDDISLTLNKTYDINLKEQHAFLWPVSLLQKTIKELKIPISYNKEALTNVIQHLNIVSQEQTASQNAIPVFDGNNYIIQPEIVGTTIDLKLLREKINEYIVMLNPNLDVEKTGCYLVPQYTSTSKEVQAACDEMNKYIQANITYPMTEPVIVNKDLISKWLSVDEKMNVHLDETAIHNWLSEFGNKYDTIGTTREFSTPTGKITTVTGGTYGWSIDENTEYTNLINNIKNGEVVTHEPAYYIGGTAATHRIPDWGNTFVEVDLSQQHMWYISEDMVVLETDVVTGVPVPEKITPEGVYTILEKKLDNILVGETDPATGEPEYRTHVNYWMRVTWSGIGFHDAIWQSAFGGTLNQSPTIGSHGCINMPLDKAAELYGMISENIPVIIHY